MNAVLAYFQGKFNSCSFKWQTASRCKVSLVDDVNGLEGSFVAVYDKNLAMVATEDDTEMRPAKKAAPPPPPVAPELREGGP
jgi:hypothetical protein